MPSLPYAVQRGTERREYAVSLVLATACEAMIRWRRLPDLARTFGLRLSPASDELEPVEAVVLPEWAVERLRITRRVMRNWPVDGACLRHALVAGQRIRSLDPILVVGVARADDGGLDAHAWLEVSGHALDVDAGRYQALPL